MIAPSFDLQEYEKFANLCWTLGWTAYGFETLKQKETKPEKQQEWTKANPSQSHIREQEFLLIPKIQHGVQGVLMLEQSAKRNSNDKQRLKPKTNWRK